MRYRFETLDIAGVTMKGLIDLSLIGVAIMLNAKGNDLAFIFAIGVCLYLGACQWLARWRIFNLESELREAKTLADGQRNYIETLMKHKRRSYD